MASRGNLDRSLCRVTTLALVGRIRQKDLPQSIERSLVPTPFELAVIVPRPADWMFRPRGMYSLAVHASNRAAATGSASPHSHRRNRSAHASFALYRERHSALRQHRRVQHIAVIEVKCLVAVVIPLPE